MLIGIAGGTGSGKTTLARRIPAALPAGTAELIQHDWYYRDRSHLPAEARQTINFDEPDPECALDCVPNQARELRVRLALNNAAAFGGNNASVAFREVA